MLSGSVIVVALPTVVATPAVRAGTIAYKQRRIPRRQVSVRDDVINHITGTLSSGRVHHLEEEKKRFLEHVDFENGFSHLSLLRCRHLLLGGEGLSF